MNQTSKVLGARYSVTHGPVCRRHRREARLHPHAAACSMTMASAITLWLWCWAPSYRCIS